MKLAFVVSGSHVFKLHFTLELLLLSWFI